MAIFLYLYLRNLFLVYPVPNTKETCTISQVHLLDVRNYLLSTLIYCQKKWFSHFFFESRSYVFPGGLWTSNDPSFTSQVLRITGVARPYLIKNSEGLLWDKGLVTEVQIQKKIRYSCYICECFVLVIAIKVKIKMAAISRWWCTLNIQRLRIWGVKIVTLVLFEASQR